jgi:protein TonB
MFAKRFLRSAMVAAAMLVAVGPAGAVIESGGQFQAAKLIHQVEPSYPRLARDDGLSDVVKFQAVVDRDGKLCDFHYVRGNAMLVHPTLQALKQWVYQPARLNGRTIRQPVEISMGFTLGGNYLGYGTGTNLE